MTEMSPDIESIELLDFEYAPPCEYNHEDCDRTAEWFWVLACCGKMFLLCESHNKHVKDFVQMHPSDLIRCADCNHIDRLDRFYISFGRI